MKTTIYELLGMIKDNKAPKRILFKDKQWEYSEEDIDYIDIFNGWLFDEYVVTYILDDEVTILETTITWQERKTDHLGYVGVVDKINEDGSVCLKQDDISKLPYYDYSDLNMEVITQEEYFKKELQHIEKRLNDYHNKINEIIDYIQKN